MTTAAQETIDVTMPQMGVSVDEGTVVEWKVSVGDEIEMDQTICEIATDKVETDVPSPASGRVVEIVIAADQTVPVGTVIARIAASGSAAGAGPPRTVGDADTAPAADARGGYTPVVRRMAEVHSLDLESVTGTGRGGRVTKRDVLAFLDERNGKAAQSAPSPAPLASSAPAPPVADGTMAPMSRMRRSIAEHMSRSLATSAHCHSFIEVDMGAVETVRRKLGVTALAIVARATVDALREHPYLNASIDGEQRTLHASVNLGIAVSLGEEGLIVPVIHDAQDLSVEGLAGRIKDLALRARSNALSPDEVRGGTFTITNPGRAGTMMSTPIINQPQVGILALESIAKHPVVVGDAIGIRPTTVLGLGWDHRALDGMLAAEFLGTLRRALENWS
jgi:pyruvate/2-oxoglutarate dehydrogenase complex dihydrolipoamide acyltransferase (E2) component